MACKSRPGERISRRYHMMAKLHKIGNQDKWMGIQEELDTRKQHLDEEDSWKLAIFKCITIVEITQSLIVKRGGKNQAVNTTLLQIFTGLLHFGGNPFGVKNTAFY